MSVRPRSRSPLTPAQADLAARHAGRAVALARRLRPWDADEAESEALVILAEAARDWPGEASGSFPGFLKSRLRLRLRPDTDRGSVAARPGGDLADRPAGAESESDPGSEPTVAVLASRLAALPRTWRAVLRLRYGLDGPPALTVAEVARRLGLPAGRVRRAERDALARLRATGQDLPPGVRPARQRSGWVARIGEGGSERHLGTFPDLEAAARAYEAAARERDERRKARKGA